MSDIVQGRSTQIDLSSEHFAKFQDASWGALKLRSVSLFADFSERELQVLYTLGEVRSFRSKSYAVIEGEPSRGLFVVLAGSASVYKNEAVTGTMSRIAHLEVDSYFGELSLFDVGPRTATVAAESECHMFYLDAEKFFEFLDNFGIDTQLRFYKTCAQDLVKRFRTLNEDYIQAQQLLWKHALQKSPT